MSNPLLPPGAPGDKARHAGPRVWGVLIGVPLAITGVLLLRDASQPLPYAIVDDRTRREVRCGDVVALQSVVGSFPGEGYRAPSDGNFGSISWSVSAGTLTYWLGWSDVSLDNPQYAPPGGEVQTFDGVHWTAPDTPGVVRIRAVPHGHSTWLHRARTWKVEVKARTGAASAGR